MVRPCCCWAGVRASCGMPVDAAGRLPCMCVSARSGCHAPGLHAGRDGHEGAIAVARYGQGDGGVILVRSRFLPAWAVPAQKNSDP